jgi:predicted amidohydrolase YtcJ
VREELVYRGRIYGLEREGERHCAMRVGADGRIAELYPEGAALPAGATIIELAGEAVIPAFIDAHAHFMSKAALSALAVRLTTLEGDHLVPDSLEGVRALLVAKAAESRSVPVFGYGLCMGAVKEGRLPCASELDAWLPGRHVIVLSQDGHSSSYSSTALAGLGFGSLAQDGILTGEAHEFNMGRVQAFVMRFLGLAAIARGLSSALAEAASTGLVSIHCLEGTEDLPKDSAASLLAAVGPALGPRLKLYLQYTSLERVRRFARRLEHPRAGGCFAWEMDGSFGSRTAAFDSPYRDRDHSGTLYRDPAAAKALIAPFYGAGYQTAVHAIGPRGIESVLSAYESLMGAAGDADNRLRLRIEHCEFPRPDQIERAGALRLGLAVQPGFAWTDRRYLGQYEKALPPGMPRAQCPLRSLSQAGCVLAISTDAPVQGLDTFVGIAGAVDHPNPSQRLSMHEALRAYSWGGAYLAFEEGERGSLAVGKYADFAVLDRDPFETPSNRASSIRVLATYHEGRRLVPPPSEPAAFALALAKAKRRKM